MIFTNFKDITTPVIIKIICLHFEMVESSLLELLSCSTDDMQKQISSFCLTTYLLL